MSDTKEIIEVDFDWVDTNTFVLNSDNTLVPAGTAVKIQSQIVFLAPLTVEQLESFKAVVTEAVDHEILKRRG